MPVRLEKIAVTTIAEQMPEAVVLTDEKGKIVWVNLAFEKMCGYSRKNVRGKKPGDFLQGQDTDQNTVRAFGAAVKKGKRHQADILNYHKNGCPYWARVSITPLRGKSGALEGFIAIERDVTKERNDMEELRGEVVGLYSTVLNEERSQGLDMDSEDPFYKLADL